LVQKTFNNRTQKKSRSPRVWGSRSFGSDKKLKKENDAEISLGKGVKAQTETLKGRD